MSTRWGIRPSEPFARETAALLAVGPNAVLSHQSAALVWGIRRERPDDAPVDVLIGPRRRTRRDGIAAHRTNRLERAEIRVCQSLPVTSPARTLRDIAGTVTMRELERAVDEALVRRIVRLQQLHAAVAGDKGRRGGPILAALLEHRGNTTITRSQAEERMLEIIRAAGLPGARDERSHQRLRGRLPWRPQRLVVEIDGYTYHSTRSAFERDRAKDGRPGRGRLSGHPDHLATDGARAVCRRGPISPRRWPAGHEGFGPPRSKDSPRCPGADTMQFACPSPARAVADRRYSPVSR